MRYSDIAAPAQFNIPTLLGASSTTVLSFAALIAIMAPPVVSMMMGA